MRWSNAMRIAILACMPAAALAGPTNGPGAIRWRSQNGGVKATQAAQAPDAKASTNLLSASRDRRVVVQFDQVPSPEERTRLERKGVKLLRYLGNGAFFARVDGRKGAGNEASRAGLHGAFEIKPEWKLHPRLIRGEVPDYARISSGLATKKLGKQTENAASKKADEEFTALYAIFHPDVTPDEADAVVARYGGVVRSHMYSINGAVIWVPSDQVQALAGEDEVQWLELPLPPIGATNDSARAACQVEAVYAPPYHLTGNGVSVMIYDGGTVSPDHPDLQGRVNVCDSAGVDDHPTHVAGTLAGTGVASGGQYRGMAPAVTIQSFGFEYDGTGQFLYSNPGDMEADYGKAINTYGAEVSNNSIGTNVAPNGYSCDWEGDYGATDMLIDAIVRGSLGSPMRIIWANGNERGSGRCGNEYHTTAPPACAKNHISVGAINSNNETMTAFSSWGPADDGRLKPDICAPGCQSDGDLGITSTMSNGGYGMMCGTSMAAPVVTGLVSLLLEDWKVQFTGQPLPTNALLKVLLAHNAHDLGNPGPDYQFGYGSVQIKDTIDFMRSRNFAQGTIDHGDSQLYFVPVVDSNQPLKITLAWDDPPGAINTMPELVNDLDLQVTSPSGVRYYPWTLDPNNPSAPAVRTAPDRLNNIEQVMVDHPEMGIWRITLVGFSVPSGPQTYSLAASPELRTCTSAGALIFRQWQYSCASMVRATLSDCDLNTDPNTVQTATIHVHSGTHPAGMDVMLTETAANSAVFAGSFGTAAISTSGTLWVSDGDTIVGTYVDADNGMGGQNVTVTTTASVDCMSPVVSDVQVSGIGPTYATISFTTSEAACADIRYGSSCGATTQVVTGRDFKTSHSVSLTGIPKASTCYFKIVVRDEAGNSFTYDNGGSCYTFVTPDRQDAFTQQFAPSGFDLDHKCLTFVPDPGMHWYVASLEPISALPVSTEGCAILNTGDDSNVAIDFTGGKKFAFYGESYGTVYVGSNGYVTFGGGDSTYTETLAAHFRLPRISVLFDDVNPGSGRVKYRQLSDRFVVTWDKVPEFNTYNSNTFQVVLFFNGTIQLAWNGIASVDSIVGLSQGLGIPADFQQDDFSAFPLGPSVPAQAFDPTPADAGIGVPATSSLAWQPGMRATAHEIYFGTSAGSLQLQATQPETTYFAPLVLEDNHTYYWRVDEVNASGRTTGPLWSFTTRPLKVDYDGDGDVDMSDFAHLQLCYTGTDVPQTDPDCQNTLLDTDTDVDAADANVFENCMTGPEVQGSANCLP